MSKDSSTPHRVGVLVVEGVNPFELGVATEIFGLDRPELTGRPYALHTCGPGPTNARQGFFQITPNAPLEALVSMDTVIVPGHPTPDEPAAPEVIDVLRRAAAAGARMVSFCSGSLVFAEAGLLDGHRATTHWRYADRLVERHPRVIVEPDVLFVEDDGVFTAAGSAAALDLSLHLVRLDHGEAAVNTIARRLVFAAHRQGDQRQFIDPPSFETSPSASMSQLHEFVQGNLDRPVTVAQLAAEAKMSTSGFHRWFKEHCGQTPQQWVIAQRVARARVLLEESHESVEAIARHSGLGTATNMRVHFRRIVGTTPTSYRAHFDQRQTTEIGV